MTPRAALAEIMADALETAPLAVSFSGGRDSSLLLAVANDVCRHLGADPPLPVTIEFANGVSETDEHIWQRRVVDHLHLTEWRRAAIPDGLDLIGPYARPHLAREGPLFPANAHSVLPLLEAARGHCLIVGLGGDELMSPQQWSALQALIARRRRPRRRDLPRVVAAATPRRLRCHFRPMQETVLQELHWLRPPARREAARRMRVGYEEPALWSSAIRHVAVRRDVTLPLDALMRLARPSGQRIVAPFLDSRFVSAFAHAGGRAGWLNREAAVRALAGDLLPAETVRRRSKARFGRVFFSRESREFAAGWSGTGVDPALVDPEALRREWLSETPDFRAASLLQVAWLAEHRQAVPAGP